MGLWYTGNMGPSRMDAHNDFCPGSYNTTTYCNLVGNGGNWGTTTGNATGNPVGIFCRTPICQSIAGITDGTSNTFLVGETIPAHWRWSCAFCHNFPISSTAIPPGLLRENAIGNYWRSSGYKSYHSGGTNFLMADGRVVFIKNSINYVVYNNLGSSEGGEVINASSY